jgi:long-chain acyl-CoA synthetase
MRRNITFPYAGRIISAGLDPDSEPRQDGLVTQSFTHGGGHYNLHVLLHLAGCICLPTGIDVAVSLEEAEALAPTYIYLAPRIMRALIDGHRARYGEAAASVPLCGGRLQWITIGGAMPDEALLAEVEARGIQIVEGYGATEISVLAMTVRGHRRPGWVGKVVPEIDVRIADDGEVMARSQYRMAGYLDNPELTRESFDDAGYYHTGDLGEIDGEGFLRIRGRKRDVFNSSEGSNIYPARIEEMLEGLPSIRQAILVGDGRPYLSALVVPDGDALHGRIASDIAGVNPRLEVFERVRRIAVLDAPFPADVYTPVAQSKVRRDRKKVAERYASVIAKLYDPAATELDVMLASSTDE